VWSARRSFDILRVGFLRVSIGASIGVESPKWMVKKWKIYEKNLVKWMAKWMINFGNPNFRSTVDGCEILHHQKDGINWCRSSQPSTVCLVIVDMFGYSNDFIQ